MAVDAAGNIYITGAFYTAKAGATGQQIVTVKYAPDGSRAWRQRFNGPATLDGIPAALVLDSSGNVYVSSSTAGVSSGTDFYTVKYDPSGAMVWNHRYNGPGNGNDTAFAEAVDAGGNVYVTGNSASAGSSDLAVVKYDATGHYIWTHREYGTASGASTGKFIAIDSSGNMAVAGESSLGYLTIKVDPNGNRLWRRFYIESAGMPARPTDLALDPSDNVIVTGVSDTGGATIKYTSGGDQVWRRPAGAGYPGQDTPHLAVDNSGGIYLSSSVRPGSPGHYSDMLTLKYNPDGSTAWRLSYGVDYENDGVDVAADSAGHVYVIGQTKSSGGVPTGILTIKYSQ